MTSHPDPVDVKAAVELEVAAWRYRWTIGGKHVAWQAIVPDPRDNSYPGFEAEPLVRLSDALSLIDRLQADNERMVDERDRLRSGLEEILCWFGEAPHTFPDWKTCAECLSDIAQNVLDGLPPLTDPEARQRLQCSD